MSFFEEENNWKLDSYSKIRQQIRRVGERMDELSGNKKRRMSKQLDELLKAQETLWNTMSERQKDVVYAELEAEKKGLKAEIARLEGDILRSTQEQLRLVEIQHAMLMERQK
jgi:predicted glycosyl hydrolase (DUF1957 family)